MKVKTKVRAGRDCGGGGLPPPKDGGPIVIWATEELIMKIRTKVRAGRDCGGE